MHDLLFVSDAVFSVRLSILGNLIAAFGSPLLNFHQQCDVCYLGFNSGLSFETTNCYHNWPVEVLVCSFHY